MYNKPTKTKCFIKKDWTVELIDKNSYNRWKKKNPEYNISYKEYLELWGDIVEEVKQVVVNYTNGVEFPLYLGTFSVKKVEFDIRCEKDLPTKLVIDENGIPKRDYVHAMSNTSSKIIWKKHRRNRNVPGLMALEINGRLKKRLSKKIIKEGDSIYQLVGQTFPVPSKCEPIPEKNIFDII